MPVLPSTPFTALTSERTDVDSPISEDLMQDMGIDLNYLKATLTDGALAPQPINAADITGNGLLTNNGNVQINGNANITGTLSTGVFYSTEQLLWLFAL
jgi:hypothetical protein